MAGPRAKRRNVKSGDDTRVVDPNQGPLKHLTESQVDRLLAAARSGRHGARDVLIVRLLFHHGYRASELARARIDHVDLRQGRIWVQRRKRSLSTEQPLTGDTLRALRAYLRTRDDRLPWLFVSERGTPFTRQGLYYLITTAATRAGLAAHPHMLRHACGFALANRGYDTRLIQDYLGHKDPKHTVVYTRTAARRFEGLWEN